MKRGDLVALRIEKVMGLLLEQRLHAILQGHALDRLHGGVLCVFVR